ncbi:MAG: hypothetical protein ACK55Z_18085, partial [bacterium]
TCADWCSQTSAHTQTHTDIQPDRQTDTDTATQCVCDTLLAGQQIQIEGFWGGGGGGGGGVNAGKRLLGIHSPFLSCARRWMVLHILFLFFVFLFCFCSIFGLFALQRLRCEPCLQMEDPPQSLQLRFCR